jgi:3D (Asp-Asp-Asp) domain-containing protein
LTHAELRSLALAILAAFLAVLLLASCGTTGTRPLPAYEPPLGKREFQNVRTTAYTDSEADHIQYGARNALGGELHAATPPIHRAEVGAPAISLAEVDDAGIRQVSNSGIALQPFSMEETKTTTRVTTTTKTTRATPTTRATKTSTRGAKRAVAVAKPPTIGSAAADWSRWPVGTTFRLLSTGQVYRVEDYGWALSGRNTIDLYMASQRDMNSWGARQEPIQVLQWGDPQQSLQFLRAHQDYKHIKRMVFELEGRDQEAAALR